MKGRKTKVLIIEDDRTDFELMEEAFSRMNFNHYSVSWARSTEQAEKAMDNDEYDLYLVDYKLGPDDGFYLIKKAKEIGLNRPFIVITGHGSYNIDIQAMEIGAENYLSKDEIGTEIFERTIRYALKKFYDRFININDFSDDPIFKKAMRFNISNLLFC